MGGFVALCYEMLVEKINQSEDIIMKTIISCSPIFNKQRVRASSNTLHTAD